MMISLLLALASLPADPVDAAGRAYGECLQARIMVLPADVSPEAGADDTLKQCEDQRVELGKAFEALIAAAPPEQQAKGREVVRRLMARFPETIASAIRSSRAGKAK